MQIFVINLNTAPERLANMRRQLGGAFERIEAVRGLDLPARFANDFASAKGLGPGEIGCYASHLVAAEAVVSRGLPYAVILEDDAELAPGFFAIVEDGVRKLQEWDVICLSGAKQHPHASLAPIVYGRHLVRYAHLPKTTAAYLLSQRGSRKLLKPKPRYRPIDVDIRYSWEMDLDGYGIFPPLAHQSHAYPSSIPKASRQRFYWRKDPLGYLIGRAAGVYKLGLLKYLRALAVR